MDKGADSYRRFLAGDTDALTEIVTMYRAGLEYYILGIVHDRTLAEDLTQETFIRLCMKKPRDKGAGAFKTWLYTIGRNLALDSLRKSAKNRSISTEEQFLCAEDPATPDTTLLRAERLQSVRHAMALLEPQYRQILYLVYFEEFSIAETAKILRKSAHNTSAQLYRAKAALKAAMEKEASFNENE